METKCKCEHCRKSFTRRKNGSTTTCPNCEGKGHRGHAGAGNCPACGEQVGNEYRGVPWIASLYQGEGS
jgi:transposase